MPTAMQASGTPKWPAPVALVSNARSEALNPPAPLPRMYFSDQSAQSNASAIVLRDDWCWDGLLAFELDSKRADDKFLFLRWLRGTNAGRVGA